MEDNSNSIDVFDYDFDNDSLLFNNQSVEYESSIDLGNIILDMGVDGTPIGAEILHASKLFKVPKSALRDYHSFRAVIHISKDTIEINLTLTVFMRNHMTERTAISQVTNDVNIPSSQVALVC